MGISRFNRRQGVQFNPLSFQELAAAPMWKQARYDQTQEKFAGDSDILATVEGTGDADADAITSGIRQQFDAFSDKMAKEGYTPGMVDEYRKLSRGYKAAANDIANWQKARNEKMGILEKVSMDADNIVVGQPNLGYADYQSGNFGTNATVYKGSDFYKYGKDAGVALSKMMESGQFEQIPGMKGYLEYNKSPKFQSKEDLLNYLSGPGSQLVDQVIASTVPPEHQQDPRMRQNVISGMLATGVGQEKSQMMADKQYWLDEGRKYQQIQANAKSAADKKAADNVFATNWKQQVDAKMRKKVSDRQEMLNTSFNRNGKYTPKVSNEVIGSVIAPKITERNVNKVDEIKQHYLENYDKINKFAEEAGINLEDLNKDQVLKLVNDNLGKEELELTAKAREAILGDVSNYTLADQYMDIHDAIYDSKEANTFDYYINEYPGLAKAYKDGTLQYKDLKGQTKTITNDRDYVDFINQNEISLSSLHDATFVMPTNVASNLLASGDTKLVKIDNKDDYSDLPNQSNLGRRKTISIGELEDKLGIKPTEFKGKTTRLTSTGDMIMTIGDDEYVIINDNRLPDYYTTAISDFKEALDYVNNYKLSKDEITNFNKDYESGRDGIFLYINPNNPIDREFKVRNQGQERVMPKEAIAEFLGKKRKNYELQYNEAYNIKN